MLAIVAVVLLSRSGWAWEMQRAVSWASTSTILLGPLLAGLAAFDIARRITPTLRPVMASARRGARAAMTIPFALWLWAVGAWLVGVASAATLTAANGVGGSPGVWTLLQAVTSLAGCSSIGAALGTWGSAMWTAPTAALLVYAAPIVASLLGAPGILAAGGATAPLLGLSPDPRIAATTVGVNSLAALTGLAVLGARLTPRNTLRTFGAAAAGIALAVALVALGAEAPGTHALRASNSPIVCVGDEVRVCGPAEGEEIYRMAARDLTRVADLGLPLGGRQFDYVVGTQQPTSGSGILQLGPDSLAHGSFDTWDLGLTAATPIGCPEFWAASPPERLVAGQGRLAQWVAEELDAQAEGMTPSPKAERSLAVRMFEALEACDVDAMPSWGFGG